MTPQEPMETLKPLAMPSCSRGTDSVAAFIQIPLNPEMEKPNTTTSSRNKKYGTCGGNRAKMTLNTIVISVIPINTTKRRPPNNRSLTQPHIIRPADPATSDTTRSVPATYKGYSKCS